MFVMTDQFRKSLVEYITQHSPEFLWKCAVCSKDIDPNGWWKCLPKEPYNGIKLSLEHYVQGCDSCCFRSKENGNKTPGINLAFLKKETTELHIRYSKKETIKIHPNSVQLPIWKQATDATEYTPPILKPDLKSTDLGETPWHYQNDPILSAFKTQLDRVNELQYEAYSSDSDDDSTKDDTHTDEGNSFSDGNK